MYILLKSALHIRIIVSNSYFKTVERKVYSFYKTAAVMFTNYIFQESVHV